MRKINEIARRSSNVKVHVHLLAYMRECVLSRWMGRKQVRAAPPEAAEAALGSPATYRGGAAGEARDATDLTDAAGEARDVTDLTDAAGEARAVTD